MPTGYIAILTDRIDRTHRISDAVSSIIGCRTMEINQDWQATERPIGIIADVSLGRQEVRTCLRKIQSTYGGHTVPLIVLARHDIEEAWRQARMLGATGCLSAHTEPRAIATALIKQAAPNSSVAAFIVERQMEQANTALSTIFATARSTQTIDKNATDPVISPILSAVQAGGIRRWIDAVWVYHDTTLRHSILVSGLAASLASHLQFSEADQHLLVRAALIHDVGKTRIPLALLNKPGPLTSDEMSVMRTHAQLGYEILKASRCSDPVTLAIARHHHELLDGSGYPDNLVGEQISNPVRLVTICDIFAALIEERSYKKALPLENAAQIIKQMGGKLEITFVDELFKCLSLQR